MYPQASILLREYFQATNWSYDNHYGTLTLPSRNLLDFPIPTGLHLSLTQRPTTNFASSLALSALVPSTPITYPPSPAPVLGPPASPLLAGQLAYFFSSAPLGQNSSRTRAEGEDRLRFKDLVQSFSSGGLPVRPEKRPEVQPTWQAGERVDKQDFLMYGRLYAPSPRLDALYVQRHSATVQTLISLISVPSPLAPSPLSWQPNEDPSSSASSNANAPSASGTAARLSELEIKLQQDTGRWSTEYSYAIGDGMWGARGLYNFGKYGSGDVGSQNDLVQEKRERVVDEEEEMSTGLKGRWSAGGEVYFSAQERSAGVSTGVRFSTLPDQFIAGLHQPPTVITATLNPIMGHLSTAYSVGVSNDTALASRFDFNMFSYDADLTVGGEWFQRRKKATLIEGAESQAAEQKPKVESWDAFGRGSTGSPPPTTMPLPSSTGDDDIVGVLKARASTNTDLALLWEGRLGDFLVSLGVVADLRLATQRGGRVSPIRSVGVGIQYWG